MAAHESDYTGESPEPKIKSSVTEFKCITVDDKDGADWYSNLMKEIRKPNLHQNFCHQWNHEDKMYVFVSYFIMTEPEKEKVSQAPPLKEEKPKTFKLVEESAPKAPKRDAPPDQP
jgi:hypothetical protein